MGICGGLIMVYTRGNKDDIQEAIHGLDIFCKNWCMNVKETEETDQLTFRCDECLFAEKNGDCDIKCFGLKHFPDYENFGAMGSF